MKDLRAPHSSCRDFGLDGLGVLENCEALQAEARNGAGSFGWEGGGHWAGT